MQIRRFRDEDAAAVSGLVCRNFLEVNIRDYPLEAMEILAQIYDAEKIRNTAGFAHMYVAEKDGAVVACGAIASFWGREDESVLLTIFVLPELHGQGIGRSIIQTLEQDEFFLWAKRIEIPASVTASEFYRKLGYDYKEGVKVLDSEGHYRMEKYR